MTMKVKDVIELLECNGWHLARIRGDHRIYVKEGAQRPIVIPGHLKDDLAIGTLKSILKGAGLGI